MPNLGKPVIAEATVYKRYAPEVAFAEVVLRGLQTAFRGAGFTSPMASWAGSLFRKPDYEL